MGAIIGTAFLAAGLWSYTIDDVWLSFAMGLLACAAVFMIAEDCKEVRLWSWFAEYTIPIFLMHTLLAAPCRVILLRLGIANALVQIGIGILISFIGPIVVMMILEKIKLDFLVYPGKLIKKRENKDKCSLMH